MHHFDTDALATFVAVADAGGFTAAGVRIGKSQAAVSLLIARFENQIGRKLFDRSRRGVHLTETGKILIGYARRIIAIEDEAMAALDPGSMRGYVRLGMPDDYIELFGTPLIQEFSRANPRIQVEIQCDFSRSLEAMVEHGTIDLALITRAPDSIVGELLRREQLIWCGSSGGQIERQRPLPLALFPEKDCRARPHIVNALAQAGIGWRAAWTSSHLPSIQAALDAGVAVTALPASVIASRYRRLNAQDDGLPALKPLEIALLVPHGARAAVRTVASFIRSHFQQL
ncbi:LysR substrate-binding domain-containing protein [Sinorhizobium meliloti]|uniref:LysR substrate-binding domain-containing protein n=1 Tax=Rhizobium meliloti TaxID=382 RepID=UPI0001E4A760|nr:LysR substrate-binding domain-containing protein [Sinorhizobium meliloti]AEG57292.1 transcriptional regulator, LysR family [Sinorhizobium meliloti AK83]MDE4586742.1 LysR family transcriptional regulator [Sinorhizobium meliloti]SEJ75006.1 DNA-binding transcriptional regulator, LysR family [Sinorhizobium meliloti]